MPAPTSTAPAGNQLATIETSTARAAAAGIPVTPLDQALVEPGAEHTAGRYVVRTDREPGVHTYIAPGDDVPPDLDGMPVVAAAKPSTKRRS